MHTFHLKDFIGEQHLHEYLEKLYLKILKNFHLLLAKLHIKALDEVF